MRGKIYTILVMEKMELNGSKIGIPDFGNERLVGYYFSKEEAFQAVEENRFDIWETCYNYAVIEEVEEGVYQPAAHAARTFFKFNTSTMKYEPIKEPDFMSTFVGLSMG